MSKYLKPPKYKRDYVGLTVESTRKLKNGYCSAPKGTLFTVDSSAPKLNLTAHPCKCCQLRLHVTKVDYSDVEILDNRENRSILEGKNHA